MGLSKQDIAITNYNQINTVKYNTRILNSLLS